MAYGRKTGGGSRLGKPNKNTADLKEMILKALDKAGGVEYLQKRAIDTPGPFLALVGKVLPMTLVGDKTQPLQIVITRYADRAAE